MHCLASPFVRLCQALVFFALALAVAPVSAAHGRIYKVLPHLLDAKGRHTLSPSLYERDAYQAYLRERPEECSGLRFDIHWKAPTRSGPLLLRLEVLGAKTENIKLIVMEKPVRPRLFGKQWSSLLLDKQRFEQIGTLTRWRASLWQDGRKLAEQRSFLWEDIPE